MNKTAIKNFAVWARRKLISEITYKAGLYGMSESGVTQAVEPAHGVQVIPLGKAGQTEISGSDIAQRNAFIAAVNAKAYEMDFAAAFRCVVEDVAYTWFNRLIAIRFMEVNDYLPSRVRVLSSENVAKAEPDFVTTPFDTDLDFSQQERTSVYRMKDDNKLDELFRMLFIKQCNKLHDILPKLFEKTADYTELLLTISFTDKDGVVWHLTHDIPEDDFNVSKQGQVEIIGWLYQYYNTEPKDEVFALLKKNVKITKERIPAATQLFTPDWIVRYLVENSLGRLWIAHLQATGDTHDQKEIAQRFGWKYYIEEAEQIESIQTALCNSERNLLSLKPIDIKFFDPCMGSGHILVYAFDVFMQIYESCGYDQREAVKQISICNLFGTDVDLRAQQLAYFSLAMKARQYSRRAFDGGYKALVFNYVERPDHINKDTLRHLVVDMPEQDAEKYLDEMAEIVLEWDDMCTVGSLKRLNSKELALIRDLSFKKPKDGQLRIDDLLTTDMMERLVDLAGQWSILVQKYDVIVTNPPYMGSSGMCSALSDYMRQYYPDSKSDTFAAFIEQCLYFAKSNAYVAMITQHAWMFLSSFEKLRKKICANASIINMAHLGARAFEEIGGEVVQTTAFVLRNGLEQGYKGTYCRLIEPTTQQGKEDMFLAGENRFAACQDNFAKIPGAPVAYWVSSRWFDLYSKRTVMRDSITMRKGTSTGDNTRFIRFWFEITSLNSYYNAKNAQEANNSCKRWFPVNTGGEYRKWYGNRLEVVNWENDGDEMKKNAVLLNHGKHWSRYIVSPDMFFLESITWSDVSSYKIGVRYSGFGFAFNSSSMEAFGDALFYIMALLNSVVAEDILKVLAPTLHFGVEQVGKLVLLTDKKNEVDSLVSMCVSLSKADWDSFETSWEFKRHPLLTHSVSAAYDPSEGKDSSSCWLLSNDFNLWQAICEQRFKKLKHNEEELNRIFIDIYGLQDELTPEVADKDVTVRLADLGRDIRSLVSYAVGCMLGRYSLDVEGLAYAGGEWDSSKYTTFQPDPDNCIPITDEEYFADDIVGRFVAFIRTVYGANTLEENLDFVAKALGNKGNTSREIIRNYFLNDFIRDHIKIYQKRPIYWLFNSGKQNGFKALVYMHRWNADTTGNVRVEYLFRMQKTYEREIARMQEIMDNSTNAREVAAAEKRKEKLVKQLKETRDYDAKIAHLALSRIDIDLDEGVKVNYQKVQTGQDGKTLDVLVKI